jgi:ornithine cyclodeaminase
MPDITLRYLHARDMEAIALTDDEIIAAVEGGLIAQARGETVIEPRMHLVPEKGSTRGHFNVLRGVVWPLGLAGVKVVGDFFDNYQHELPSEMAMLYLADPKTGRPIAIIDATAITTMRTGAVTAVGGKHLARKGSKVLGHIGARGTAYWNVRLLNRLFDFDEIRVHSRRKESRDHFAAKLAKDLGKKIVATEDWQSCVEGADVVVEASRLEAPAPMLKNAWIKKGALVMPYGTMSALEDDIPDIIDKWLMDDFGQANAGPFGALRKQIDSGRLNRTNLHAEIGQVAAGMKPGREREDETILFWHRGLSLSDIALGAAALEKAKRLGIGQELFYAHFAPGGNY